MAITYSKSWLQDRISTLSNISGLEVRIRSEKGQNVFEFFMKEKTVKTCFTYNKAKVFAEGVLFGKTHSSFLYLNYVSPNPFI